MCIEAQSGGFWVDPAMKYSGTAIGSLGLINKGREITEWEFIRQASVLAPKITGRKTINRSVDYPTLKML